MGEMGMGHGLAARRMALVTFHKQRPLPTLGVHVAGDGSPAIGHRA